MKSPFLLLLISFTFLSNCGAEEIRTNDSYVSVYEEICNHVEENFYDTVFLKESFPSLKAKYNKKIQSPLTQADFSTQVNALLKHLEASHTYYLSPDDYEYYHLASIFSRVPAIKEIFSDQEITYPTVGIITEEIEDHDFIISILAGSNAEKAGLLAGDEIISVNGKPYEPVNSLRNQSGQEVVFSIKRTLHDSIKEITIEPITKNPKKEMLEAEKASIHVIESADKKIGYIHIYSYAGKEYHEELLDAISWGSLKDADALIIDLRYGLGGANPNYLNIFNTQVPVISAIDNSGKKYSYDTQWRKPAVYLVNRLSRSGKEILAFGAKKYELATVIGERTAGAVVRGTIFPLSNGDLLYLATRDSEIDGVRLEGAGVEPDINIPMDIRYSQGKDKQLEAAVEYLSETLNKVM